MEDWRSAKRGRRFPGASPEVEKYVVGISLQRTKRKIYFSRVRQLERGPFISKKIHWTYHTAFMKYRVE